MICVRLFFLLCLTGISLPVFVFAESSTSEYEAVARCITEAGEVYNAAMRTCVDTLGTQYAAGAIDDSGYIKAAEQCTRGPLFDTYQRTMTKCYEQHSFGPIWDVPLLKQALARQGDGFSSLTPEQSAAMGTCFESLGKQYNLYDPNPEAQRGIANCFALGGWRTATDLYDKAAVVLDCAKESSRVQGFSGIASVIERKNPNDEAFIRDCVIERTAPVVTLVSAANIPAAVGGRTVWMFGQFLFTQPFYFLYRRKAKTVGKIFNTLTKTPVDLSIVRLIDQSKDTVIKSMVTGQTGAYIFLPPPGNYRVEVDKQGFAFPSTLAREYAEADVYLGEPITVETKHHVVDKHVPIDPAEQAFSPKGFFWNKWKRRAAIAVSSIGPLISLLFVVISPSPLTWAFVILHALLLFVFFRLHHKRQVKYGIVFDEHRRPLSGVTVSLFSRQYNKLVAYYVSDVFGRYFFPAALGEFDVVINVPAYKKQEIHLNITPRMVDDGYVGTNIYLTKTV